MLKEKLAVQHAQAAPAASATPGTMAGSVAEATIFTGCTIRPMIDGAPTPVEAIGVAGGYVVALGTLAQVQGYFQGQSVTPVQITLQSTQVLLPGLIEPHVHIVPTALMTGSNWLDLSPFDGQNLRTDYNIGFLTTAIQAALNAGTSGWILGHTVDPALMPFTSAPTETALATLTTIDVTVLDGISNTVPILLWSASMHTLYLNTPALTAVFNNPANEALRSAYNNSLTAYINATQGQLQEAVGMTPALESIPPLQLLSMAAQIPAQVEAMFAQANALGVTMMYDAAMDAASKVILGGVMQLHPLNMRVGAALVVGSQEDADGLTAYVAPTSYSHIYYGHVKLVSDGSNQGLTGYQYQPYCCFPADNHGIFNFGEANNPPPALPPALPPAEYTTLVATVSNKGWPLMIHANGDAAVNYTMDAYEQAWSKTTAGRRNRIEHCSLLDANNLARMQKFGISPSFLIGHLGYWGYVFQQAIFGEKVNQLDLCQSALKNNLVLTLHSDHGVSPLGPLRMMEQAITRIMEGAPDPSSETAVLMPSECLTPTQALCAATYGAAWQCYAENWCGSLAVGHFADFVILEQDPLAMGQSGNSISNYQNYYMKMRNIPVYQTWVGGAMVYPQHS
jgi:predicted amidohydrolase YtcJ